MACPRRPREAIKEPPIASLVKLPLDKALPWLARWCGWMGRAVDADPAKLGVADRFNKLALLWHFTSGCGKARIWAGLLKPEFALAAACEATAVAESMVATVVWPVLGPHKSSFLTSPSMAYRSYGSRLSKANGKTLSLAAGVSEAKSRRRLGTRTVCCMLWTEPTNRFIAAKIDWDEQSKDPRRWVLAEFNPPPLEPHPPRIATFWKELLVYMFERVGDGIVEIKSKLSK